MKHYIIPLFIPHFGCPHTCVFCNQRKITGMDTNVTAVQVEGSQERYYNSLTFI